MTVLSKRLSSNIHALRKKISSLSVELAAWTADIREKLSDPLLTNIDIGLKHYYEGRYSDAIIRFRIIRFLWKKDIESLAYLGSCYAKKGQNKKAREILEMAIGIGNVKAIYFLKKIESPESIISIPVDLAKEFFEYAAESYVKFGAANKALYDSMLQNISKIVKSCNKNMGIISFLDLGCGTGGAAIALAELCVKKSVVGVDISGAMIDLASKAVVNNSNVYNVVHNMEMHEFLSKSEEKFDFIMAIRVLEYYGDLRVILELCHRRLSDYGCFIFISPKSINESMQFIPDLDLFCYSEEYIKEVFTIIGIEKYEINTISLTTGVDYLKCTFFK